MHIIDIASFIFLLSSSSSLLLLLLTVSTAIADPAETTTTTKNVIVYNVKCSVNHKSKAVTVHAVNNKSVDIVIASPGEQLTRPSMSNFQPSRQQTIDLHLMYHFPGVASNIIFPPVDRDDRVVVLMSNGALMRAALTHVIANFHTHDGRMVYGQLRSIAITDYSIAEKIYIGAPIFKNGHMVSVVTCRHDDFDAGVVLFPVTGARSKGLISGHVNFDDNDNGGGNGGEISVRKLGTDVTIYGTTQLPFVSVSPVNGRKFALAIDRNRSNYRNLPRRVVVFHNATDVSISLVEGQFEIERIHFDGPLVETHKRKYR